jgi:hypothetical protein
MLLFYHGLQPLMALSVIHQSAAKYGTAYFANVLTVPSGESFRIL